MQDDLNSCPSGLDADVMFIHCTFNGNGGYINHQYNDRAIELVVATKNDEIRTLKEQIINLRRQNDKLIELLDRAGLKQVQK